MLLTRGKGWLCDRWSGRPWGLGRGAWSPGPEAGFPHRQPPKPGRVGRAEAQAASDFSCISVSWLRRMQLDLIFLNFILEQEHFYLPEKRD